MTQMNNENYAINFVLSREREILLAHQMSNERKNNKSIYSNYSHQLTEYSNIYGLWILFIKIVIYGQTDTYQHTHIHRNYRHI